MRIEIADNSSGHGEACSTSTRQPSFSETVQEGSAPCVIVVIYFANFYREMYTESCQTQMQIFVTLKLNKFTTEKCAPRMENWKTKRVHFARPRFVALINFRTQRPDRKVYLIFLKETKKYLVRGIKSSLSE